MFGLKKKMSVHMIKENSDISCKNDGCIYDSQYDEYNEYDNNEFQAVLDYGTKEENSYSILIMMKLRNCDRN